LRKICRNSPYKKFTKTFQGKIRKNAKQKNYKIFHLNKINMTVNTTPHRLNILHFRNTNKVKESRERYKEINDAKYHTTHSLKSASFLM